jgi:hypothetical protein
MGVLRGAGGKHSPNPPNPRPSASKRQCPGHAWAVADVQRGPPPGISGAAAFLPWSRAGALKLTANTIYEITTSLASRTLCLFAAKKLCQKSMRANAPPYVPPEVNRSWSPMDSPSSAIGQPIPSPLAANTSHPLLDCIPVYRSQSMPKPRQVPVLSYSDTMGSNNSDSIPPPASSTSKKFKADCLVSAKENNVNGKPKTI